MARGRPRKQRVKVIEILDYIASLPEESELKQHMTPEKMVALKALVYQLESLDGMIVNLKADIAERGEIEMFEQGSQKLRRTNPAVSLLLEIYRLCRHTHSQIVAIIGNTEAIIERQW